MVVAAGSHIIVRILINETTKLTLMLKIYLTWVFEQFL